MNSKEAWLAVDKATNQKWVANYARSTWCFSRNLDALGLRFIFVLRKNVTSVFSQLFTFAFSVTGGHVNETEQKATTIMKEEYNCKSKV